MKQNMELYIGGFAQGKLSYVQQKKKEEQIPIALVIDCAESGYQEKLQNLEKDGVTIVNHLHLWVRDLLMQADEEKRSESTAKETILSWAEEHPKAIFICDEIGNGIVPIEKKDRIWREQTGRLTVELASRAERVERILCGLGQRLK